MSGKVEEHQTYNHVRRRLIICCDGTWQSSVSGNRNVPSNVTRMCRHLHNYDIRVETNQKTNKEETTYWNQVVYYDAGIGTGAISKLETVFQGGTGSGLDDNIIEAYNFIVNNWLPGDKIYIFGFSRGAYTARALSGLINDFGICDPLAMEEFPNLYKAYEKRNNSKDSDDYKNYAELKGRWERGEITIGGGGVKKVTVASKHRVRATILPDSKEVEVVGVWDTVGSLGVPDFYWFDGYFAKQDRKSHNFYDVSLSDKVKHAFHALALDERRRPFTPTLWRSADRRDTGERTLRQVWFPGVHINIGGGSDDMLGEMQSDFEQLSNITFAWMVEQCRPHLAFDDASLEAAILDQNATLDALEEEDQPNTSWLPNFVQDGWRSVTGGTKAKVKPIRKWGCGPIIDSWTNSSMSMRYGGWYEWRQPGATRDPNPEDKKMDPCYTNEEFHPSIAYRRKVFDEEKNVWEPDSLKGFDRREVKDKGQVVGWQWTKRGKDGTPDVVLPEYRIKPTVASKMNLERLVLHQSQPAEEWYKTVDAVYNR